LFASGLGRNLRQFPTSTKRSGDVLVVAAILAILMISFAILSKNMAQMAGHRGVQLAVAALILGFIAILGFQVVNKGSALANGRF